MSAAIKIVPRDERVKRRREEAEKLRGEELRPHDHRLKITAVFNHRRIVYDGDIFAFIRMLMDEGWTGDGSFRVNEGRHFFGLTFDMRKKEVDTAKT